MIRNIASLSLLLLIFLPITAFAAMPSLSFTINMSENVVVNTTGGTPTIALTVDNKPRVASYLTGTGTNALTFTYAPTVGDVDLDGITITSPYNIILNSGTIKDAAGNNASLSFTPPVTTGVKVNYPSLSMDFVYDADGRYTLNGNPRDTLSAFLTDAGGSFTRASIGTYFDSTGTLQTAAANTPRFDYDPVTHTAKGILIEENRTNLILYSEQIDNAAWVKGNIVVSANATTSPSGTTTAELMAANTVNSMHPTNITGITQTSGTVYTMSYFAKAGGISGIYSGISSVGAITVNLNTCSMISSDIGPIYSVTSVGNGWCRIIETYTSNGNLPYFILYNGGLTFAGDGISGVYIWGFQIEQGSFATSYIPTTTAAATRASDSLSIPVGSWYSPSSSWASVFQTNTQSTQSTIEGSGPCSTSASLPKLTKILQTVSLTRPCVGSIVSQSISPATSNSVIKAAFSYDTTSSSLSTNGLTAAAGSAAGSGPPTVYKIGGAEDGISEFINGYIQKIKYYPLRATDTQLQLMSQ